MYDIIETFEDFSRPMKKSFLFLKADKGLNFQVSYPITWKGYLNNEEIQIRQVDKHSKIITSFQFDVFPKMYEDKRKTVTVILDKYLKRKGI